MKYFSIKFLNHKSRKKIKILFFTATVLTGVIGYFALVLPTASACSTPGYPGTWTCGRAVTHDGY